MSTLFEQTLIQNSRCFACGSLVYAVEKKITTNHVYHNRCFRCRICKRNLTGYSLNEEGDDIYCEICYRRKLRGDCNSFEFYRAAAEKAQYVHNRHHPNQQNSLSNPRPSNLRDVTRHPSLSLRQLERQFLSYREPKSTSHHHESIENVMQKALPISQPLTINTNFSTPINLMNFRRDDLSFIKNEPSSQRFSSIFSPSPTVRTEATITPRLVAQSNQIIINDEPLKSIMSPTGSATAGIEFRLNKSSIDLTNVTSPQTDRKSIIIPDLNEDNEPKESRSRFTDFSIVRRRSSSARHLKKALRGE